MIPGTSKSLLQRLRSLKDEKAWSLFHELYSPWIHGWAMRAGLQRSDADELVQEVMAKLVKALPKFEYESEKGLFRGWLKTVFRNQLRIFWRRKKPVPIGAGGDSNSGDNVLDQLADPNSGLSQLWNDEHERYIARRSMELVEPEFEAKTWRAFWCVVVEDRDPEEVAAELGMTRNNVYQAKRRVLLRVREMRAELDGIAEAPAKGKPPKSDKRVQP